MLVIRRALCGLVYTKVKVLCLYLSPRISSPHHVILTRDNRLVMENFKVDDCVCGYHHYKNVWSTVEEEVLQYV